MWELSIIVLLLSMYILSDYTNKGLIIPVLITLTNKQWYNVKLIKLIADGVCKIWWWFSYIQNGTLKSYLSLIM